MGSSSRGTILSTSLVNKLIYGIILAFLIGGALSMYITCLEYFFLDELVSLPPLKPPSIVFKLWCGQSGMCPSSILLLLLR